MMGGRVPGWVWVVLVAVHGLALGWGLHSERWDFPDSGRYVQAAENLRLHGELYARPWPMAAPQGQAVQEFTIRPVGYPLVILGLGREIVALLAVQNLFSLLNMGLVLNWWARRGQTDGKRWLWALAGVLTFPAQLIYANAVMSEILLQTVILGMMAAALLYIRTGQARYGAWGAVAMTAGGLLKPVFFPLALLVAAGGGWLSWRQRKLSPALIGALPLVVVLAYMGWNMQRTGYFHFSSIAEINLVHYNAAGVVRQLEGPGAEEQWVAVVLREADAQPDFATRQRVMQARAGAVLWAHPVVYARQHLQGMATFFLDPGRFDVSQFLGLAPPPGGGLLAQVRAGGLWQAVGRLPLGLLAGLGVLLLANGARLVLAGRGFGRLRHAGPVLRYGRWVALGLILYVALLTGPLGAARFMVPVWPLLLGLALVGLETNSTPAKPEADGASE